VTLAFRTAAAPKLPPVITSLSSSMCSGSIESGTTVTGLTGCLPRESSILINGKNFLASTYVTPGLCAYQYFVSAFQLACVLNALKPDFPVNVQAFTPSMGVSAPTGFTVEVEGAPVVTSLSDPSCTTPSGLTLSGCPSVGNSELTVTGKNFLGWSLTTGLCTNAALLDATTIMCRLTPGITPGSTLSVVVTTPVGASRTDVTISF
jgi:hypothetical protein